MNNVFKIINQKMRKIRKAKVTIIINDMSIYHALTGKKFNVNQLLKDLHMSYLEYDDMMAKNKSVKLFKYNKVIRYIEHKLEKVDRE